MSNLNSKIYKGYCKELRERINFLNKDEVIIDVVSGQDYDVKFLDKLAFELLEKYRTLIRNDSNRNIIFVKDNLARQGGVVAVRDSSSNELIYLIDYIKEGDDITVYGGSDPYKIMDDGEWYVWSKNNFVIDWQETVMAMKEYMIIQKVEDSVDYSV